MILTEQQEITISNSLDILDNQNLHPSKHYEVGFAPGNSDDESDIIVSLTFPDDASLVSSLELLGWTIEQKYENNGDPSFYTSDLEKTHDELEQMIHESGKRVVMVRMILSLPEQ